MKTQCSSMVSWRAIYLLAGSLMALSQAANAQDVRSIAIRGVAGGGHTAGSAPGAGVQFVQEIGGSGPQRGLVVGNASGPLPGLVAVVGASLLKTCDPNQDGAATSDEVKVGLLTWFRQADTDTNGALSEIELATALKQVFPQQMPQTYGFDALRGLHATELPPGLPPPPPLPEEQALHNQLARKLMASVDANKDGWMTFKEAIAFVGQSFPQWDADSSGWLAASEFSAAFAQFLPAPSLNSSDETSQGPSLNWSLDR